MGKTKNCIDCNKPIWEGSTRCKSCSHKGKLNTNFKDKVQKICCDCGKPIVLRTAMRCQVCSRLRGKDSHFYGKRPSQTVIDKLVKLNKQRVGKLNHNYGKGLSGDKNPNWRDGSSVKNKYYPSEFRRIMRPLILKTYTYCQWCSTDKKLVVHHIDHDVKNNEFCNLITLCNKCNVQEYRFYMIYKFYFFRNITEKKYGELYLGYQTMNNPYPGINEEWINYIKQTFPEKFPLSIEVLTMGMKRTNIT